MTNLTSERAAWIARRAEQLTGRRLATPPQVIADTSDFMAIDRDSVLELEDDLYLVTGTEREKRFGLADEPKFWVKRALSLNTGRRHIVKLEFHERFRVQVGDLSILCVRNAEKEGRVLELVQGDPRFMQGRAVRDVRGNLVRVIDFIEGTDLLSDLCAYGGSHEQYLTETLPGLLPRLVESFLGVQRLHRYGLCHGDIRNDHILLDALDDRWRWIDFDLDEGSSAYDVWTLGNILHCVVAKGFVTFREALDRRPDLIGTLTDSDASVFFPFRVMNLIVIYPCIPVALNDVLLRFSVGARTRYDKVEQVVEDLGAVTVAMGWPLTSQEALKGARH